MVSSSLAVIVDRKEGTEFSKYGRYTPDGRTGSKSRFFVPTNWTKPVELVPEPTRV